jgi:hypothetical protein
MQHQTIMMLIRLFLAPLIALSLNACAARAVVGAGAFAAQTTAKAARTTVKTGAAAARLTGRAVGGTVRAVSNTPAPSPPPY